jgi:hypothetical protein
VDGDSAAGFVEGARGRRFIGAGVSCRRKNKHQIRGPSLVQDDSFEEKVFVDGDVPIAKGATNCRLGDIHTLLKSVDTGGLEHVCA